jgi:hypothetical protein
MTTRTVVLTEEQLAHVAAALAVYLRSIQAERERKPFDLALVGAIYVNNACGMALRDAIGDYRPTPASTPAPAQLEED